MIVSALRLVALFAFTLLSIFLLSAGVFVCIAAAWFAVTGVVVSGDVQLVQFVNVLVGGIAAISLFRCSSSVSAFATALLSEE